ncbi:siroheme decarboxylase subunit beta [Aliamphritea spongicola]|uniref:siroheme decarboxylase subunit beta n=1 Tax=Aliamphritea spongicola TaxID=707589 RepID=UPI00196B7911|nr:Lrp/AsnC family transcriptional regulator [Aliamphritea spongicola]MBN3564190.1 Lrp/AsnC family transcriptional regulator [Aliamphritea spongicola]
MKSDAELQVLDRDIILKTQAGLPLIAEPYQQIAAELDIDVELLMQRIRIMQEDGRIRRIGAVPNHYRLGYTGNGMSVWDVPDEKVHELGEMIGALDYVSHCYHRPRFLPDWPYNLFAMVHGRSREEVIEKAQKIADLLGEHCRSRDVLFSSRILKKTGIRIGG